MWDMKYSVNGKRNEVNILYFAVESVIINLCYYLYSIILLRRIAVDSALTVAALTEARQCHLVVKVDGN